jgi:uncharacterized membrane protein required for colicin V production
MDHFQLLFLGGSALLMLVESIRGWRTGVARQLVNLFALVLGYACAVLAGKMAAPILHPLGYPDLLMSVIAGAICFAIVYYSLKYLGSILFRRTREQSLGLARLGYGAGGSFLGFVGAVTTIWLSVIAIHCLGTVAQAEVNLARTPEGRKAGVTVTPFTSSLAQFKQSIDSGPTGALLTSTDPVPTRLYSIFNKIAAVISNVDSMQRFVAYPGTEVLSENPKIQALRKDPQITQAVARRDYMGLLGNPKIAAAVNDPSLEGLVRGFQLEKALDYALNTPPQRSPSGN